MKKVIVLSVIALFIGVSFTTSTGKIDTAKANINDGSLLGYVNDTSGNPFEGALVRVYFHESYEEDYSDEDGYYHVTNIPICYCLKNVSCSKECYTTEWVLLSIVENTTHDFILNTTNHPPEAPRIIGPGSTPSVSIKAIVKNPVNFPPGKPIEFRFEAIDPDSDDIRYHIDWGDGTTDTTGFYPSGEEVKVNHTYNSQGTYTVSAYAEDTCGLVGPVGTISIPISLSISTEVNNEIEPLDTYREIFTKINICVPEGYIVTVKESGGGILFRHVEIWSELSFDISGYYLGFIFPRYFSVTVHHIVAPRCFVAYKNVHFPGVGECTSAFAIGNIEWS